MTFDEICRALSDAGIENARNEAMILLEEICGADSLDGDFESKELSEAVRARCGRYPLQYIIGKWWFSRCVFEVNEHCLIPRPDTEVLVDKAVRMLPEGARFADLCTGSGCIAVSVLDLRRDTACDAYELYPETLDLACRNAERNGVGDRFCGFEGDVLTRGLLGEKRYAAILSNPPYIRRDVIDTLSDEVKKEPRAALDGGEDGLVFYRAIIDNFADNLESDGFFLFEIGYDQAKDVCEIARDRGFECKIIRDLSGQDRVALLRRVHS